MKRNIIKGALMFLIMVTSSVASAQYYYWSGGNKIELTLDPTQVVVVNSPSADFMKTSTNEVPSTNNVVTVINDEKNDIKVIRVEEATGVKKLSAKKNSNEIYLPAFKSRIGEPTYATPYIDIRLKNLSDENKLESYVKNHNMAGFTKNEIMPYWYTAYITSETPGNTFDIAKELHEYDWIQEAIPDISFKNVMCCSNDTLVLSQWPLYNTEYPAYDLEVFEAWNIATGRDVVVAVIDQAIDNTATDLINQLYEKSFNATEGKSPSAWYDPNKGRQTHGTVMASIIAAERNNTTGIAGIAPDSKIMAISCINNQGSGSSDYETQMRMKRACAIKWATLNGADVINNSWTFSYADPNSYVCIDEAIKYALDEGRSGLGCVVVFSSGKYTDNKSTNIQYPSSSDPRIIVVGAVNNKGIRVNDSCYGYGLDVVAPGDNVLAVEEKDSYGYSTGTSPAAACVSGIAALVLEKNPSLTTEEVHDIICSSAAGSIHSDQYGWGYVNALRALELTPDN